MTPREVLRTVSLLIALLSAASGCRDREAPQARPEPSAEGTHEDRVVLSSEALAATDIQTAAVERRALADELRATAMITANENRLAHVSGRIPGRAVEVLAILGNRVEPGQTLAHLDSLELGERKSTLLQARTNLTVARRNYEREARLYKQRISSEKEYLEARGDFERSEAAYRAAREALRLVGLTDPEIDGVTWGGADHPLSHFPLLAPFEGTVIEKHITVGELVKPEDHPYTIADLTTVWVLLDVYEKDLARARVGANARIAVDAYPGEEFHGTVTYVSSVLNPDTRTAEARVEIDNTVGRLRPGMFATATIDVPPASEQTSLVIPHDAVQRVRGEPVAFVEEKPGAYLVRALRLGKEAGPHVEILTGLAEGERVVTAGAFYLKSSLLKDEMGEHD